MAKSRQDVVGVYCVKDAKGKVLVENDKVKEEWRKYMEKLLNEENAWDNATTCENVEGPCELIRRDDILNALRMMKKGKSRYTGSRKLISSIMSDTGKFSKFSDEIVFSNPSKSAGDISRENSVHWRLQGFM